MPAPSDLLEGLGRGDRIDRSDLHHLLVKQGCKDDIVDFVLHAKWQELNSRSWRERCEDAVWCKPMWAKNVLNLTF